MTTGPSQAPDPSGPPGDLDPPAEEEDDGGRSGPSLLDRLRGTGVGVEDPNISADADLTDAVPDPDPAAGAGDID